MASLELTLLKASAKVPEPGERQSDTAPSCVVTPKQLLSPSVGIPSFKVAVSKPTPTSTFHFENVMAVEAWPNISRSFVATFIVSSTCGLALAVRLKTGDGDRFSPQNRRSKLFTISPSINAAKLCVSEPKPSSPENPNNHPEHPPNTPPDGADVFPPHISGKSAGSRRDFAAFPRHAVLETTTKTTTAA